MIIDILVNTEDIHRLVNQTKTLIDGRVGYIVIHCKSTSLRMLLLMFSHFLSDFLTLLVQSIS